MARTRRGSNLSVSLFPFLSILCCIIGTLTLLLAGIAAGKGNDGHAADEYVRVVEEKARAESEKTQAEKDSSELASLIAQAEALAEKLKSAREELKRWEEKREAVAQGEKSKIDALAKLDEQRKRIADLKAELARLEARIRELEKVPDRKGSYQLRPHGSGTNLHPRFVECVKEGIWLDPDRPEAERRLIAAGDIVKSSLFTSFLQEAWGKANGTVIFVVREGGVDPHDYAWFTARSAAKGDKNKHVGSLPVPGKLPVDYSAFKSGDR